MPSKRFKETIGIAGMIGSGKSYVAELISRERGYKLVKADEVFKTVILPNPMYQEEFSEFVRGFSPDTEVFVDGVYQSNVISSLMFNNYQQELDYPILKAINAFNYSRVRDAIQEEVMWGDCILEMATLPTFGSHLRSGPDFRVSTGIIVMGDCWSDDLDNMSNHYKRIMNRDHRDEDSSRSIIEYQTQKLKPFLTQKSGWFRLENIDTLNVMKGRTAFNSDEEILRQFDHIAMSSWALTLAKLPQNS